MTWEIEVRSDLFEKPHPEDSSPIIGEDYYVVARNERGTQYAHFAHFRGLGSARANEAQLECNKLAERIQAAIDAGTWCGPVKNDHWQAIRPAYGSQAYVDGDWTFRDYEAEQAENAWPDAIL